MNIQPILLLSTCFLFSSINASQPAYSIVEAHPKTATTIYPQPGNLGGAWQYPIIKTIPVTATSNVNHNCASVPGSNTIIPTLNHVAVVPTQSADSQQADGASSAAPASSDKKINPVELDAILGGFVPIKLLNALQGTDQTVLNALRQHDINQPIISTSLSAQTRIISCVRNLLKNENKEQQAKDVLEFMSLVKKHKIHLDQTPRRELREYLKEYERKQESELIETYTKQVSQLQKMYDEKTKSMQITKEARDQTYQGESDNEENIRQYKPTSTLMRFQQHELISKIVRKSQKS